MEMKFGPWFILFDLEDGARIKSLKYKETELLTTEPIVFRPPKADYGMYETRPVYGYDDCFPSVGACFFPESKWQIPDHGEVCWLPWQVRKESDNLYFSVKSKNIQATLIREMHFTERELIWDFEVKNTGNSPLPFQHVMHPLMPLDRITELQFPDFGRVYDEISNKILDLKTAKSISEFLLSQPPGTANMLYLQNVVEGKMTWKYSSGIQVKAIFPRELFPSIGIWWNNEAYPGEDHCRRTECAFEPIPGSNSTLSDVFQRNECLIVQPGQVSKWQIKWTI